MGWSFGGDWATMREQPEAYPVMLCDLINAVNAKWPIVMRDYWGLVDGRYVFGTTLGQAWVEPEPADMADMRLDLLLGELVHELNETIWSLIYGSVVAWCPENTWVNAGDYVTSEESHWFPVKYGGGGTVTGPWDVSIVEAAGYARWGGPTSGTRDGVVSNLIFFKDVLSLLQWGWIRWDRWTGEDGAWEDGGGRPFMSGSGLAEDPLRAWPGTIHEESVFPSHRYPWNEDYPNGPNTANRNPEAEFMPGGDLLVGGARFQRWSDVYHQWFYVGCEANNVSLHFRPGWASQIPKFGTPVGSWSQWRVWTRDPYGSDALGTRHGDIFAHYASSAETMASWCVNGASAAGGIYPSGSSDVFYFGIGPAVDLFDAQRRLGTLLGVVTWYDFGGGA